jgi:hypothetical protein
MTSTFGFERNSYEHATDFFWLGCIGGALPHTGTARAQIFVTNFFNTVGEYNATTGATINSSFISSGLSDPFGIALSGGNLFVANGADSFGAPGTIGEYNATTGATINSSFISSGLSAPNLIAVVSAPVPDASSTLPLLLLGIGATFGLNLLLHRRSES